jgi:hypothetical protein
MPNTKPKVTTIETTECDMPAAWACAIVNGDWSGLDSAEIDACRAALSELAADQWRVVSTTDDSEGWFGAWRPRGGERVQTLMLTYILHKVTPYLADQESEQ